MNSKKKNGLRLLVIAFLGLIGFGFLFYVFGTDSPEYRKYQLITVGMTVEEVEALLGPGTAVSQREVPGIVVALNSDDDKAEQARARLEGGSPPTTRDYPTRIKPAVEGDRILKWENAKSGVLILAAFKNGTVCMKYYWNPTYL